MNNQTKMAAKSLLIVGLLILSGNASAQQGTIQLEHKAEQWETVTDDNGVEQTQLVEATNVLPGERVLFSVTYTNNGDQAVEEVVITNPVPDHMVYIDNSASGDNTSITFSVDGGESFGAPRDLLVTDASGTQRPATAKDFTHVRWIVESDIASGASDTVQFSAVVD